MSPLLAKAPIRLHTPQLPLEDCLVFPQIEYLIYKLAFRGRLGILAHLGTRYIHIDVNIFKCRGCVRGLVVHTHDIVGIVCEGPLLTFVEGKAVP